MYTVKVLEGDIYVNTSSELLVPSSNTTENCENSKGTVLSTFVFPRNRVLKGCYVRDLVLNEV